MGLDALIGNGINGETRDIVTAMAIISDELNKLSKSDKEKFDEVMMTGNDEMKGDFLSTVNASLGIPLLIKAITG